MGDAHLLSLTAFSCKLFLESATPAAELTWASILCHTDIELASAVAHTLEARALTTVLYTSPVVLSSARTISRQLSIQLGQCCLTLVISGMAVGHVSHLIFHETC